MSRIHEALKKAEEEKQSGRATTPDDATLSVVAAEPDPLALLATPTALAEQPASAVGQTGAMVSWEALLARCPQRTWSPDTRFMLFLDKNHHDQVGMEEFRTLRSRLYQIRDKHPLKIILVGSALPGEGKTFVSANLAQALARQHGRRVLLIDGDLRKAHLHECFGTTGEPGLTQYLLGEIDELAMLQRGQMEGLFFLPAGKTVSNPAELVANGRLKVLLARLAALFDWIVIDSPPVVPVSDATLLAGLCDGILLVVEAANTPYEMAQRARQEFHKFPLLGVVLNRVQASAAYGSYYYSRYGYQSSPRKGEQTKG